MKKITVSVIGAGAVGSTTAYALMLKNSAAEIVLVDCNQDRCVGEVFDLADTLPFSATSKIVAGDLRAAAQADIIVIAAGARQKPGQERIELLEQNAAIVRSIMQDMSPIQKDAIIIMVTNPVDSMTLCAQSFSGLPRNQVFGTGTFLDTQRLLGVLSARLGVAQQSIDAWVLGEHGETQFVAWSGAHVAGVPLSQFGELKEKEYVSIAQQVKHKVHEIIERKQATYFGVAACVAQLCEMITFDQKYVVPLSCYQEQSGVCISVPVVLGQKGIERYLPLNLNAQEQQQFDVSVAELKQYCQIVTCEQV